MIISMEWRKVETCSLTVREEQRLRVSEDRVLRKIFEDKRNNTVGRKVELHNL
jgi:hypothetical protein